MKSSLKHSPLKRTFFKGMRDYMPFILCVVISAALWLTREMGKTYEEQITIPVVYENVPKSLVLVSEMPDKLNVFVEAPGWGLLSFYLWGADQLKVDVSDIVKSNYSHISTKDAKVLEDLGTQLKVLDVYPTEIQFSFEKVNTKRVAVKHSVSLSYAQQYELDGTITVSPDSVSVYGAKKYIDTIRFVYAKPLVKKKLRNSFSDVVELVSIPNVSLSEDKVTVSGAVEKFTEQTITVPIKLLNMPQNGVAVDLMTEKVTITFLVGMSKVQSYYPSDFEAVADFEKRTDSGSIPVEIVRYPQYVRIINQNPMSDGVITNFMGADE